jgi:hypothetical protein
MTAVLLVRFHVRRNLGLGPEGEQAGRRKNTHEHGGGQQGFFRRYQMSFEPRAPGEWYAVRLVLGRNWINDDNLKATYKEEGEQWQYGFFNLRRRCSARR